MDYLTDSRFIVGLIVGIALTYFWHSKMGNSGNGSAA